MRGTKSILLLLVIAASLLVLPVVLSTGGTPQPVAVAQDDPPYPIHGWQVCADLGTGPVPGIPGTVQILQLCQGEGWRVQVYCLEPLEPAPPLDTFCSYVGDGTFWCGDQYQLVREYIILDTPSPTETPTPTATATLTATPTSTPQASATGTVTAQPSQTTTAITSTPQAEVSPTVFDRPPPGGPGNLPVFLGLAGLAMGLILFGAVGILRWARAGGR